MSDRAGSARRFPIDPMPGDEEIERLRARLHEAERLLTWTRPYLRPELLTRVQAFLGEE